MAENLLEIMGEIEKLEERSMIIKYRDNKGEQRVRIPYNRIKLQELCLEESSPVLLYYRSTFGPLVKAIDMDSGEALFPG